MNHILLTKTDAVLLLWFCFHCIEEDFLSDAEKGMLSALSSNIAEEVHRVSAQ